MTDYGVTATGFVDKPLEVILEEVATELKASAAWGPDFDATIANPAWVVVAVLCGHVRQLWEVAQAVYAAMDPDANDGAAQVAVASLTGTLPQAATPSTVEALLAGTTGSVIPSGSVASVDGAPLSRFALVADATLAAATAWVNTTVYAAGAVVRNGATQRIYLCITGGTSAGSGGPDAESDDITDGTVHWRFVGLGAGYVLADMEGETSGPVGANAYTLTEIETPRTGWSGVVNPLDATAGQPAETEAGLRLRREEELRQQGASAVDAIRADLLQVADVTAVSPFNNPTAAVDGDGLPAHSFEMVVLGGTDQAVADQIWESGPGGIQSHGTTTQSVTDSQGGTQSIKFTRPTTKNVYLEIDVTVDADTYPADGDDQIETAVAAFGDEELGIGDDVILAALYAAIFSVSGVLDVTAIRAGFAISPVGTANLTIGIREIADLDTTRVLVTST